ncbi:MAG: hypothetical protein ABMA26_00570 [Limisphaerales bacterium]
MEKQTIKTVNLEKHGRFWAVRADGELLALVLYKKGALAVRDLLVRLAGIPANEPPKGGRTTRRTQKRAEPSPSPRAT